MPATPGKFVTVGNYKGCHYDPHYNEKRKKRYRDSEDTVGEPSYIPGRSWKGTKDRRHGDSTNPAETNTTTAPVKITNHNKRTESRDPFSAQAQLPSPATPSPSVDGSASNDYTGGSGDYVPRSAGTSVAPSLSPDRSSSSSSRQRDYSPLYDGYRPERSREKSRKSDPLSSPYPRSNYSENHNKAKWDLADTEKRYRNRESAPERPSVRAPKDPRQRNEEKDTSPAVNTSARVDPVLNSYGQQHPQPVCGAEIMVRPEALEFISGEIKDLRSLSLTFQSAMTDATNNQQQDHIQTLAAVLAHLQNEIQSWDALRHQLQFIPDPISQVKLLLEAQKRTLAVKQACDAAAKAYATDLSSALLRQVESMKASSTAWNQPPDPQPALAALAPEPVVIPKRKAESHEPDHKQDQESSVKRASHTPIGAMVQSDPKSTLTSGLVKVKLEPGLHEPTLEQVRGSEHSTMIQNSGTSGAHEAGPMAVERTSRTPTPVSAAAATAIVSASLNEGQSPKMNTASVSAVSHTSSVAAEPLTSAPARFSAPVDKLQREASAILLTRQASTTDSLEGSVEHSDNVSNLSTCQKSTSEKSSSSSSTCSSTAIDGASHPVMSIKEQVVLQNELALIREEAQEQRSRTDQMFTLLHNEALQRRESEHREAKLRYELQEQQMVVLKKDLEAKRSEALAMMRRAQLEMREAAVMVAEAREERAKAMEQNAKAAVEIMRLKRKLEESDGNLNNDGIKLEAALGSFDQEGSSPAPLEICGGLDFSADDAMHPGVDSATQIAWTETDTTTDDLGSPTTMTSTTKTGTTKTNEIATGATSAASTTSGSGREQMTPELSDPEDNGENGRVLFLQASNRATKQNSP